MIIQKDIQLKPFNTFGIEATAKYFIEVSSIEQLQEILQNPDYQSTERLILGGGSNMLLTKDFEGLVIKIDRIKDRFVIGIPEDLKQEFYDHLNEFKRFIVAVDTEVFERKNSTTIISYYLHTYLAKFKSSDAFELYSRSPLGGQIQMNHDFDHKILFKTYRTIKQLQLILWTKEK
jgi:hypothetical protein